MITFHQILSLGFPDRPFVARGDAAEWLDGLPPPTAAEMDAARVRAEAALAAALTPGAKRWPSVQEFTAEFGFEELAAVSLSTHPTIAAMRMILATWRGEVHADDARVQAGLGACVEAGILTAERRASILDS